MSILRRTDQGGSVVTFIIVGVILAAGLIGTAFFLKQHGDQVRKDQAIAASDQQKKATEEAVKSEDTKKSDEKAADSDNNVTVAIPSEAESNSTTDLPTTGPELAVGELVSIFLLTVASAGYMSSRRNLTHSL